MTPIQMVAELKQDGRRFVFGEIFPDHYVNIPDYSSGSPKNISVRVNNSDSQASVYEFPDGGFSTIRHPGVKYLPLSKYTNSNLDAVLTPGKSFSHDYETRSHAKGCLTLTYISPKKHKKGHYF